MKKEEQHSDELWRHIVVISSYLLMHLSKMTEHLWYLHLHYCSQHIFFIFMLLMINFVTVGTVLFWEAGGGGGQRAETQ